MASNPYFVWAARSLRFSRNDIFSSAPGAPSPLPEKSGFKLDLHIHTQSFGQTVMTETAIRQALRTKGLAGIAVTNFFNISHALWLKARLSEFLIIVGQEIWSRDGHITALGLTSKVPDFQRVEDTLEAIHRQGGIAVAVHPYLHMGVGDKIKTLPFDAVEVYNAVIGGVRMYNFRAAWANKRLGLPGIASSDTTDPRCIGQSYTTVLTEKAEDVLPAITRGEVQLTRRPLPIPIGFILKNYLQYRDVDPCPFHASPCSLCGKSLTVRLVKKKFFCHDCGKEEISKIGCCNGHYLCRGCLVQRIQSRDEQALQHKDFYLEEENA